MIQEYPSKGDLHNMLKIYTMGNFDLIYGEKSLIDNNQRSYKTWELLKFMLTHRGKKLLPEYIIKNIGGEVDYSDPKGAFRTQVYRLRKMIESMNQSANDLLMDIVFVNGCYSLELGKNIYWDLEQFEGCFMQANHLECENEYRAIDLYKKAINIYKGDYLSGSSQEGWVIPIRNKYRRMFVQAACQMITLLNKKGADEEILNVCETILEVEPFEDFINVKFMESLSKIGRVNQALNHYQYITTRLCNETGLKPTPLLTSTYEKIQQQEFSKNEVDIFFLEKEFRRADEFDGPLFCDLESFESIYRLEARKRECGTNDVVLGLITISRADFKDINIEEAGTLLEQVTAIIQRTLRKGDVFAKLNNTQIVVLLTGVQSANVENIKERILKRFEVVENSGNIFLYIQFKKMVHIDHFYKELNMVL